MQLYVGVLHWRKVGQGKHLTWPLRKKIIVYFIQNGKRISPFWLFLIATGGGIRTGQLMLIMAVTFAPGTIAGAHFLFPVYWGSVIALYLDDYFTDNNQWKRRWEGAKNRIKWLWTPAPIPIRVPN